MADLTGSKLQSKAEAFAIDDALLKGFRSAVARPLLQKAAIEDVNAFLKRYEVRVPRGLQIEFRTAPSKDRLVLPGPDFFPFVIRQFNCRTYWLKKRDGPGFEQVTVCFGFEIRPTPMPPGPVPPI